MEGIARAKANGVYASKGRPASIDATRVREMKARGFDPTAIAKRSARATERVSGVGGDHVER
jgi:hypothetical protein